MIDTTLASYASVRQLEFLEALSLHGTVDKAAQALGINRRSLQRSMESLKNKSASQGWSPAHDMTRTVPEGYKVRGVSTYYDEEGKVKGQWVKSTADDSRREEQLKDFAESLAQTVQGLAKPIKPPEHKNDDLMVVIPVGDPHFGMYAWAEDAGGNFDLDLAEQLTCAAIDRLVLSGPDASAALLLNLGDMFHADNQKNTTQSGHQLDVDGRWAKVQKVGLRAMIYCMTRLLEKYPKVIFRINKGNHDGHSSYALALMLSCYFHNEPRVDVDTSSAVAWYYQFGKVLLGSSHGDTLKGKDMMSVMAADKPQAWGSSEHRYWYVGHVHHRDAKEYPGGIVEYFRTLAARDAWHQGQGYRSGRDMCLIVHHKDHGEIERHRVDIGMIE